MWDNRNSQIVPPGRPVLGVVEAYIFVYGTAAKGVDFIW